MSAIETPVSPPHDDNSVMATVIRILEKLDNLFHVIVAAMFILLVASVIVHTCVVSVHQASLVMQQQVAKSPNVAESNTPEVKSVSFATPVGANETHEPDRFLLASLESLSSILFIVIILELLRTILTYLQTHNIQAIMREFIVVGIISSIRKILLVGAESSLAGTKGIEFEQEAIGTLLTIFGILALIFGLWMLERVFIQKRSLTSRGTENTSQA